MKQLLPVLMVLGLSRCTMMQEIDKQTEAGRQIRRTSNPEVTRGCTLIGPIHADPNDPKDLNFNAGAYIDSRVPEDAKSLLIFLPANPRQSAEMYRCPK